MPDFGSYERTTLNNAPVKTSIVLLCRNGHECDDAVQALEKETYSPELRAMRPVSATGIIPFFVRIYDLKAFPKSIGAPP
jgi:hypothetical protein